MNALAPIDDHRCQGKPRRLFAATQPADTPEAMPVVIKATPFVLRKASEIPPRQFLYRRHLIRGFVSATIAPGGVGKSALAIVDSLAMSTNKSLLGIGPAKPLRVWYWSGEDPMEETERRIAAACLHFGIVSSDIGDRLFTDSGRKTEIILAHPERSGFKIALPVKKALIAEIRVRQIDVLIVDPFISSHRISENDNGAVDAVVKTWALIADATGCAIDLVHHTRKNGGAELTAEDGRGASAMVNAARSVRVLNPMSQDEAAKAGVDNRLEYFRVDKGKANLAPRSDKSDWYRIVSEPLDNGQGDYPGDDVGVVTAWKWPDATIGVTVDDLKKVQARIADGVWAENCQASNWAGFAVADSLEIDPSNKAGKARVASLLHMWIAANALKIERRHDSRNGRDKPFVIVGDFA